MIRSIGALIAALVAYFDKKIEDEGPKAMLKEILAQRRAPEIAQPPVIAHSAALANPDPIPLVLDELRGIVAKLSTSDGRRVAVDRVCAEIQTGFKVQKAAIANQKIALIA